MKLKPNTIFVAAEEKISFDVTSLERNKTVEGNFALMELRNTSIEREGSGVREREHKEKRREGDVGKGERGSVAYRNQSKGGFDGSIPQSLAAPPIKN